MMARRFRLAFSRALEGRNRWLEDGRGRRAAAHLLTRDEARCIAANSAEDAGPATGLLVG
jgi:hypothetical protein